MSKVRKQNDMEKGQGIDAAGDLNGDPISQGVAPSAERMSFTEKVGVQVKKFEQQLVKYNLEARGIQRVEEHERHPVGPKNYLQIFLLWFSINLAANNVTLGMLAPAVYQLSFLDASLCAVFGSLLGSIPVAYIAIWGPISGNRTMIFARYTMGWWPSRLIVILNIIVLLGYSMIDCVVAGQILSAVSPNGSMSVIVGIIIAAVITWVITTFGIQFFHQYERFAFIPQVIVLSILFGVSGSKYDIVTPSQGDARTIAGNRHVRSCLDCKKSFIDLSRLSFFSLCLSAAITYGGAAADFFVYYAVSTSPLMIFSLTLLGLTVSFSYALILGIGLASGIATNPNYASAYQVGQGALLVEGFSPLNGFGKFCAVVVALGLIANIIPPTYSSGVDFQILGRYAMSVPRFIWNTFGVVVYTVCALAGRNSLSEIFTNFLALMGYWVAIWIAITLEEHLIFRRHRGYNWAAWNDRSKLPLGIAALIAFLVGWAGAILCMAQVWYIGPIAKTVGEYGADMGNYVGFAWAAVVYPPLRYFELKRFGQ